MTNDKGNDKGVKLTNRHKTFETVKSYKGVHYNLVCVTTSKKRFSEISGFSESFLAQYCHTYDLRYAICNSNPDVLFCMRDNSLESQMFFDDNQPKTFEELKELIDNYREKYPTYRDYLKHNP